MKAELRTGDAGGPTLYVGYQAPEYQRAINEALAAYNLERGRIRIVAYPTDPLAEKGERA
jgi:hypothetical protein